MDLLGFRQGWPRSAENLKYAICPDRQFDDVELTLLSVYRGVNDMVDPLQNCLFPPLGVFLELSRVEPPTDAHWE